MALDLLLREMGRGDQEFRFAWLQSPQRYKQAPIGFYQPMLTLPKDLDIAALEDHAERGAALLRSIGNKWRLVILCQLVKGERSVGELERVVGLSQSALSQHLMVLRRGELVKTRRAAQMIFYSLRGREATAVLSTLHGLYCPAEPSAVK